MINLLPSYQKEKIKNERKWRFLARIFLLFIIFLILISFTIFFINRISVNFIGQEKNRLIQYEKDLSGIIIKEGEIKFFNSIISDIELFYQESIDLVALLEELYNIFPDGSYVDSFLYERSIDVEGKIHNQIIITGYTSDWQSLLEIEKGLEERFNDIEFSPGVWTQISDINFSISFKIR